MSDPRNQATPKRVIVCGVGAVTPLGLGAAQTTAQVHAGLSGATVGDMVDASGDRVVVSALPWSDLPVVQLPPDMPLREQEIVRLAVGALSEVTEQLTMYDQPLPTWWVWPERSAGLPLSRPRCASWVGSQFVMQQAHDGAAASVAAVAEAAAWIQVHGGLAVVVAADSLVHPFILATLLAEGRVKTKRQPEGVVPGQGAAALLLGDHATVARLQLPRLAEIGGCGQAVDPQPEPRGDGLSAAIRQAMNGCDTPVAAWWTTLTGERAYAQEHSTAAIRSADLWAAHLEAHHVAMNLGDTGAAAALLATVCALSRPLRPVVISATADGHLRAALLLLESRS